MPGLRTFAFVTIILCPLAAQSAPQGVDTEIAHSFKVCPKNPTPDSLRQLAQSCAKDLDNDPNCRTHTNDKTGDYVVVKDCSPNKPQGYLAIPVQPVTGIEDPRIFSSPLSNLWDDAWRWSQTYLHRPTPITALAVNSKKARSQNQLHIHIGCVPPGVNLTLANTTIPFYPAKPVTLQLGLSNNTYKAVKVRTLTGENSPFNVARAMAGSDNMADQGIAVIGSRKAGEYYVLDTTASGANRGHAEDLLDQVCPYSPLLLLKKDFVNKP